MGSSIKDRAKQLSEHIETIEAGIKECANILTGKKVSIILGPLNNPPPH